MSATHRPKREGERDAYFTPAWVTELLLPHLPPAWVYCVEPSCGDGGIAEVLFRSGYNRMLCIDIADPSTDSWMAKTDSLPQEQAAPVFKRQDFLQWRSASDGPDLIVGNPPFNSALEFAQHALEVAHQSHGQAWFLLRLAFLESARRVEFLRKHMPDVYVLPRRPSFTGGGTDSAAYAWMCFHAGVERSRGSVQVL